MQTLNLQQYDYLATVINGKEMLSCFFYMNLQLLLSIDFAGCRLQYKLNSYNSVLWDICARYVPCRVETMCYSLGGGLFLLSYTFYDFKRGVAQLNVSEDVIEFTLTIFIIKSWPPVVLWSMLMWWSTVNHLNSSIVEIKVVMMWSILIKVYCKENIRCEVYWSPSVCIVKEIVQLR